MSAIAASPPRPQLGRREFWLIIGALLLGLFLAALDQTIVSTALPTIVGELGGLDHLSWVVTSYLLASTAATPLWGKLGDLYGRKRFFQAAIVIFLAGSALCGAAQSLGELIAFRAIQGLGGGGLIVGAQSIIGDVVSPRERGRYQGLFGAVFGVASVLGPLAGGLIVDHLSWRWVFYVNLPIGVIALVVTAAVLPATGGGTRRVIDYLGTALVAAAATGLILVTTLGGTTYAWDSAFVIGVGALSIALIGVFLWVEHRAVEPVIPLRLFANRVFAAASAVGFVVGFAMFGALTFLPLFLQVVKGVDPTESGVRLLPLIGGLLITSIGSGQIIARRGRYKVFPVVGTAVMTVGLFLLSRIGVSTSGLAIAGAMFVFGAGLGAVMQVLILAVQNAVDYRDLGTATSNATFFRSIGGSFGTAIFGAIFANVLVGHLADRLHGVAVPPGLEGSGVSPAQLARLPADVHAGFIAAYADSLHTVFLVAVPFGVVAFGLTWLLPEISLRATTGAVDQGDAFGMPSDRTSLQEVERAVSVLAAREERRAMYGRLAARAGLDLGPRETWLLYRFDDHPRCTAEELVTRLGVEPGRLDGAADGLAELGLLDKRNGDLVLSPAGRVAIDRLTAARRDGLADLLQGWSPDDYPELAARLHTLAHELLADDDRVLAAARAGDAGGTPAQAAGA